MFRRSTLSLGISLIKSQASTRKKRSTFQCLGRSSCYLESTARSPRRRVSSGGLVSRSKPVPHLLLVHFVRRLHHIVFRAIISRKCKLVHCTFFLTFPLPTLACPDTRDCPSPLLLTFICQPNRIPSWSLNSPSLSPPNFQSIQAC